MKRTILILLGVLAVSAGAWAQGRGAPQPPPPLEPGASQADVDKALLGAPARIPIDLLLTDVVMPILGGHELAHRLMGASDVRRVLFISGYAEEWVRRQDRHAVGGAFLRKPFTPETLARKVRDVLDDRAG